jgi:hypothetical protein
MKTVLLFSEDEMTRSEFDANRQLAEKRNIPAWQRPAPVRPARKVTLPQWLIKYLWRL